MASPRAWHRSGKTGVKLHDERVLVFISDGSECECLRVCVWRRSYVTDPRPTRCVRQRRRPPGPFKVMAPPGWELRRIEGGGFGNLPSSLSFFFWFFHPFARICFFQRLLPLHCLSLPFITTGCLCAAPEESALGSWCDTVMRGDVVIQQFQPKGHICSLSFALHICPNLPFLYLSIEDALCSLCSPSTKRTFTTHFA